MCVCLYTYVTSWCLRIYTHAYILHTHVCTPNCNKLTFDRRMTCIISESICYVFGGRDATGLLNDLYTWHTDTKTWTKPTSRSYGTPSRRALFSMFAVSCCMHTHTHTYKHTFLCDIIIVYVHEVFEVIHASVIEILWHAFSAYLGCVCAYICMYEHTRGHANIQM